MKRDDLHGGIRSFYVDPTRKFLKIRGWTAASGEGFGRHLVVFYEDKALGVLQLHKGCSNHFYYYTDPNIAQTCGRCKFSDFIDLPHFDFSTYSPDKLMFVIIDDKYGFKMISPELAA